MNNKGVVSIIVTIFVMLMLAIFVATASQLVATDAYIATNHLDSTKAFYVAQAGLTRARVLLATGEWAFNTNHTEADVSIDGGTFSITTNYVRRNNIVNITATGYVPNRVSQRARRIITETSVPPPVKSANLSLSSGVIATASSSVPGQEPPYSKDANYNTYWQSNTKNGSWLALTFASPVSYDKVVFYQNSVSITAGNFRIQYKSGSNWINVGNPLTSGTNPITVTFDSVASDGVRIYVDVVGSGKKVKNPNVSEFETYSGPDNLLRGLFSEAYQ